MLKENLDGSDFKKIAMDDVVKPPKSPIKGKEDIETRFNQFLAKKDQKAQDHAKLVNQLSSEGRLLLQSYKKEIQRRLNPGGGERSLNVGRRVKVDYKGLGEFFPGVVRFARSDGTYDIVYDDGDREAKVEREHIQPCPEVVSSAPTIGFRIEEAVYRSNAFITWGTDDSEVVRPTWPSYMSRIGARVEVNYRSKGTYFPGTVRAERPDGTFDIDYEDGEQEAAVPKELIRAKVTAAAIENMEDGATVLQENSPVKVNYKNSGKFYTGKVRGIRSNGTFDIAYDDGDSESAVPRSLIEMLVDPVQSIKPASDESSTKEPGGLAAGSPVKVNYKNSGNFYPGRVKSVRSNGTLDIAYDDGDTESEVPRDRIQCVAETAPAPAEEVKVGSPVKANYKNSGIFYPGKVRSVRSDGTLDIAYDDGDTESAVPRKLVQLLFDEGEAPLTPPVAPTARSATRPVVAIVGAQGSGKSTLLRALGGTVERPTSAAAAASMSTMGFGEQWLPFGVGEDVMDVHWLDLPSAPQTWPGYLADAHCIVWVADAAADEPSFAHACQVFKKCFLGLGVSGGGGRGGGGEEGTSPTALGAELGCGRVSKGKPLLVLANKQDEPGGRDAATVRRALALDAVAEDGSGSGGLWGAACRVEACSVHPFKRRGPAEDSAATDAQRRRKFFDEDAEAGLEWLLGETEGRFAALAERVADDVAEAEAARLRDKEARKRRVFTKVLREKAFPAPVPAADGSGGLVVPTESCFDEVDGFEFLAMELLIHDPQRKEDTRTAAEQWGLPPVAQQVAKLVGFQKTAMIMVADMANPEAKPNKATHTWAEIVAFVRDRRADAGLSRYGEGEEEEAEGGGSDAFQTPPKRAVTSVFFS